LYYRPQQHKKVVVLSSNTQKRSPISKEHATTFLELVANDLYSRFGDELSDVTLVFPNRRASLFFSKHLSFIITKPTWAPPTIAINDIMINTSGLTPEDPIKLVFTLHSIYQRIQSESVPIEDFYFWGDVMLSDFDEVDRHLVDAKQLYSNIKDLKEIENSFGGLTPQRLHRCYEH